MFSFVLGNTMCKVKSQLPGNIQNVRGWSNRMCRKHVML